MNDRIRSLTISAGDSFGCACTSSGALVDGALMLSAIMFGELMLFVFVQGLPRTELKVEA